MYAYYNTLTGAIVGGTGYGVPRNDAGITTIPAGADAFAWIEEGAYPDFDANMADFKIVNGLPVHLTQEEIDARNAAYVPPEPTTEEKLADARKQVSVLQASVTSANNTINSLIDYVMTLPTA